MVVICCDIPCDKLLCDCDERVRGVPDETADMITGITEVDKIRFVTESTIFYEDNHVDELGYEHDQNARCRQPGDVNGPPTESHGVREGEEGKYIGEKPKPEWRYLCCCASNVRPIVVQPQCNCRRGIVQICLESIGQRAFLERRPVRDSIGQRQPTQGTVAAPINPLCQTQPVHDV